MWLFLHCWAPQIQNRAWIQNCLWRSPFNLLNYWIGCLILQQTHRYYRKNHNYIWPQPHKCCRSNPLQYLHLLRKSIYVRSLNLASWSQCGSEILWCDSDQCVIRYRITQRFKSRVPSWGMYFRPLVRIPRSSKRLRKTQNELLVVLTAKYEI